MNRLVIVLCALVAVATATPFSSLGWKVVGGADAEEGQFPYQISMRVGGSHYCGGSIIAPRWILTAAHCVDGVSQNRITIAVGSIQIDDPNARVYQPENIIIHNGWSSWSLSNDAALIQLTEAIETNENVQIIPLNTENLPDDTEVILSGWGDTWTRSTRAVPDILQWVTLRTLNQESCQNMHWSVTIRNTHLCTIARSGLGACHGDSGGPLVSNGRLAGVVSFGIPCARGEPDVFTNVASFVDWINENIAENSN